MVYAPRSFFENEDLIQLRQVFVESCDRLEIGWTVDRAPVRERIANLIMLMARGESDPEIIQRRVMLYLQN
ncbi:hypothetical protein [Hyphomicrobium sp.]|uniref:hypothetical protein n=1 Tax=Hyphomicrobium sp. TaxID=82 RepID=UPI002E313C8F|nr:hypothetical protein [Hyphomicrobium sp.]HEX2840757.1 hypothetical protein [Hyphomicrobium sp.]